MPTTNRFIKYQCYFATVFLISTLSGCSTADHPAAQVRVYQQRLANVLDVEPVPQSALFVLKAPPKRRIIPQVSAPQLSLIDFQRLSECRIGTLIAERNTALGKVMTPSQRLVYEKALLAGLSDCIEKVQESSTKAKLKAVYDYKQDSQSTHWASLWLNSEALTSTLFSNQGWLLQTPATQLQRSKYALRYLNEIYKQSSVPTSETLEQHLQHLSTGRLLAKGFRTQRQLTLGLTATTEFLQATADASICLPRNAKKLDYLQNVFQLFFIEKIQATAGELAKVHHELYPLLEILISKPGFPPSLKAALSHHLHDGKVAYDKALKDHVGFWQQLLKNCRRSPQRS